MDSPKQLELPDNLERLSEPETPPPPRVYLPQKPLSPRSPRRSPSPTFRRKKKNQASSSLDSFVLPCSTSTYKKLKRFSLDLESPKVTQAIDDALVAAATKKRKRRRNGKTTLTHHKLTN